jgi:hypothetical protein
VDRRHLMQRGLGYTGERAAECFVDVIADL